MEKLKLNLGSNKKRIDGYVNVDILDVENVDIKHDLTVVPYPFADKSVDEILAVEVLEHIGIRHLDKVLREWHRILKVGGHLSIQVPDIEKMFEYKDLQCSCVPRKASSYEEYKANPLCTKCLGRAKIHPERWLFAFTGAQKHPYDAHLNIFTPYMLKKYLGSVGFIDIEQKPNIYKLIINCSK